MAAHGMIRRDWLGASAAFLASLASTSGTLRAADPADAAWDVEVRRLGRIPPGTEIADGPPREWTHLILKSQPRVGAGDVDRVPDITASLAGLLFSAMVANVRTDRSAGEPRYTLGEVAMGLGTKVGGKDIIVSSDSQRRLGANLGFLADSVLSESEKELDRFTEVARGPNLTLFDIPAIMVRQGEHRPVVVRHAVMVHSKTGYLATLLWLMDVERGANGGVQFALTEEPIHWLKPNLWVDHVLSVDADQFTLGIPSATAFAMVRVPPGFPLQFPQELRTAATVTRYDAGTARTLERRLWQLMHEAAKQAKQRPQPARTQ